MGNRTRLPELLARWRTQGEAEAARAEALAVVERWNVALTAGRGALWSPTIRAAVTAGTPWPGGHWGRDEEVGEFDRHHGSPSPVRRRLRRNRFYNSLLPSLRRVKGSRTRLTGGSGPGHGGLVVSVWLN